MSIDLDRRGRRAALTHELIHDERGLLPQGAPPAIRTKDEHAVRRETARRLVPTRELLTYAAAKASTGEPVTIDDIANHFDVPKPIAVEAVAGLGVST